MDLPLKISNEVFKEAYIGHKGAPSREDIVVTIKAILLKSNWEDAQEESLRQRNPDQVYDNRRKTHDEYNDTQYQDQTIVGSSLELDKIYSKPTQEKLNVLKVLEAKQQQPSQPTEDSKEDLKEPTFEKPQSEVEESESDPNYNRREDPTQFQSIDADGNLKWNTFARKSIFVFSYNNKFRLRVIKIITHPRFDKIVVFFIMVNSLLLGMKDYKDELNCTSINKFVESFEPFFMWSFLIECGLKIIGMGFILDLGSYLRNPWNWLDFIVVLSSLLTEIPQLKSISSMRTIRLLRPLRTLTTMPSMKILIGTLIASVTQLGGVLLLAIFFFTIFAILGVSLWSGAINKRCRLTEFPENGDWVIDESDPLLCSEVRQCGVNRWCGSLAIASRSDDPVYKLDPSLMKSIYRDSEIEDLNFGITNFDNLGTAFLTIFQCITLEGWINVCQMFEDSYDVWFVDLYFLLCIIVCSMFVLNLTIAVMLLKYEEFDRQDDNSIHSKELHEYGEKVGIPIKLVEFIIDQDNLEISKKGQKELTNKQQESLLEVLIKSSVTYDAEDPYYKWRLTQVCFIIVNSPIFNGFIIFIILCNTVLLSLDQYPLIAEETSNVFAIFNIIFTVIFTVELIPKVIGLGVKEFVADPFNRFDTLIVMVSLVEMMLPQDGESGGAFSALRAFRLFRILKIFRAGQLRTLLDCIAFTVFAIQDYLILLALFIFVFALLGMSFFAGKATFNSDNVHIQTPPRESCDDVSTSDVDQESPRANFDSLMWASLTVFEIMIGENWNGVMYDHMRSGSHFNGLFFVALVILGNIIMLNLFLAILLGNFDRARNMGEKKKIFDAFDSMNKLGHTLEISIMYLFDDIDFARYIYEKVLQLDEFQDPSQVEFSDELVAQVYTAIRNKKLEEVMMGSLELNELEIPEGCIDRITDIERARCLKILLKLQRLKAFNDSIQSFFEEPDVVNKEGGEQSKQPDVNEVSKEFIPDITLDQLNQEKNDESISTIKINEFDNQSTIVEKQSFQKRIYHHCLNSSLLLFPQNSFIRKCCQLCVQTDQFEEEQLSIKRQQASEVPTGSSKKMIKEFKAASCDDCKSPPTSPLASKKIMVQSQSSAQSTLLATQGKKTNMVAKLFEAVILTLIMVSSVTLIVETPFSDPHSSMITFFEYLDNCFTILFSIEALIKIIAMGFLFNDKELKKRGMTPYITNPWNMLDFVVVVASLIDFILAVQSGAQIDHSSTISAEDVFKSATRHENLFDQTNKGQASTQNLQSLKALRALRALRPLRMISRNPGMKLIVNALLASIPNMANVAIVCCLFLLIFAIMGVDQFKGEFYKCSIEDPSILQHIKTKEDCLKYEGEWENTTENFDNVAKGARTLFEMMSTEGWIDVMNNGIDAVGIGMQPSQDHNLWMILYFVVFMVFGSQFILNLFVGVIMDNFNRIKDKEEWGGLFVTEDQKTWIDAQRLGIVAKLAKKIEPPLGVRGHIYKLVNHSIFEGLITFTIIFNTAVMASRHDGIKPEIEELFYYFNMFFATIFNIEMILKLIGLDKQYFYSSWNLFDMAVVAGTDIGILMDILKVGKGFSAAGTIIRAFRIMRIIRLVRQQPDVKIILDTLMIILPQITNFIALMFLLLFIYAALGINLFGGLLLQEFITDKSNFRSIGSAMLLLFRCSTGEDWNKVMYEVGLENDGSYNCFSEQDYHITMKNNKVTRACGVPSFNQFYMLSFTFIISWLIMNLSVAAVIEGLENAKQLNSGLVTKDDIQQFLDRWQEYDPKATGWIQTTNFVELIIELQEPFGNFELATRTKFPRRKFLQAINRVYNRDCFHINEKKNIILKNSLVIKTLEQYQLVQYVNQEGKLHFKDVYQQLVARRFNQEVQDFEVSQYLTIKINEEWMNKYRLLKKMTVSKLFSHHYQAGRLMVKRVQELKDLRRVRHQLEKHMLSSATKSNINLKEDNPDKSSDQEKDGTIIIRNELELNTIKTLSTKKYKIGFADASFNNDIYNSKSPSQNQRITPQVGFRSIGNETIMGSTGHFPAARPLSPQTSYIKNKIYLPSLKNVYRDKRKNLKKTVSLQQ